MSTGRRAVMMGLFWACCLVASTAFAKPNFSGQWKLDASRSNFGSEHAPAAMSVKVHHQDPNLHIVTTLKDGERTVTAEAVFRTDGRESSNTLYGVTVKTITKWEGDALVTQSRPGDDLSYRETWRLSPDGKVLTMERHLLRPQEADQKYVLERQ